MSFATFQRIDLVVTSLYLGMILSKSRIFLFLICMNSSCIADSWLNNRQTSHAELIQKISSQLLLMSSGHAGGMEYMAFPMGVDQQGNTIYVEQENGASGFYPGILWQMYGLTGNDTWKKQSIVHTGHLEAERFNSASQDLGLKMMSSFGLGFEHTKAENYRQVLIQSARTLVSRFDENVGSIKSWYHQDKLEFPVIIDSLMNLELLFWAWKETGEPVFYNIALTHSRTTAKNHFRDDYSSYHMVNYDTISGAVKTKSSYQGTSGVSICSKVQAWALYGYTMIYRETGDLEFLELANNIAHYIINVAKLPTDFVPYSHLTNTIGKPKDTSAAAIMASALYELSNFSPKNKEKYLMIADGIIGSLSSDKYFSAHGENNGFLLTHSVGSLPTESKMDVPLIHADYYYLEALSRKMKLTIVN